MFLKVYVKERTMCTLSGVIDPKTFRYRDWQFTTAIANLEPAVVSISIKLNQRYDSY